MSCDRSQYDREVGRVRNERCAYTRGLAEEPDRGAEEELPYNWCQHGKGWTS